MDSVTLNADLYRGVSNISCAHRRMSSEEVDTDMDEWHRIYLCKYVGDVFVCYYRGVLSSLLQPSGSSLQERNKIIHTVLRRGTIRYISIGSRAHGNVKRFSLLSPVVDAEMAEVNWTPDIFWCALVRH